MYIFKKIFRKLEVIVIKIKYCIVLTFISVLILSVGCVSAADTNITEVDTVSTDNRGTNNVKTVDKYIDSDVSTASNTNDVNVLSNTNNDKSNEIDNQVNTLNMKNPVNNNDNRTIIDDTNRISSNMNSNIIGNGANPKTFTDLNNIINGTINDTITLDNDYTYISNDSAYKNGIIISRNNIVIDGNGHTIDGAGQARIFNITGENVIIKNLFFTNGNNKYGGAIYITGTNCTVINSTFKDNKATRYGGAIYWSGGDGTVINSTFTGNNATYDSGAIYWSGGDGTVINSTFTDNNATTNAGAISWSGVNGTVINSTFTGNNANSYGGAIYWNRANGTVINSTFTGNNATYDGGVIYWAGVNGTVINSTFTSNNANRSGGAIYMNGNNGNVINSTFTGNNANNYGGAIYWYGANGTVINSTFTDNNANSYGGAIRINGVNCTVINSTFTDNNANSYGGAIYISKANGNVINSTFTSNNATNAGAIYIEGANGTVINSTFTSNNATNAGAIYIMGVNGTVSECNFINNTAINNGGAIYWSGSEGNVKNSYFINNKAASDNLTAVNINKTIIFTFKGNETYMNAIYVPGDVTVSFNNVTFWDGNVVTSDNPVKSDCQAGINITIEICNSEGSLVDNVTLMTNATGQVSYDYTSLLAGNYTCKAYHADDKYYTYISSNATITIVKTNTTLNITPITNVKVGQEVTINYTTNSNGTVIIKVNNITLSDDHKFTPNKEGIYNVTVEVTETEYYTGASNETTFKAEKTNTYVNITDISDVKVGETVTIKYDTNSNGTVIIKVNNITLSDDHKFTPTKAGIYNVTVEVTETEYYTGASNETTFKAEKTNPYVVISPISDVKVGETVKINYVTNSNGTVTIKVNGQKVTGGKFIPTTNGTYNVTVEVAENDYYTQATNQTTFNAKKVASKIIVRPITAIYDLDKYLVITLKDEENNPITGEVLTVKILGNSLNYFTDAKGQVKIKVPTSGPKTYNPRIKYAGSDKYKASSALGKVTVKKATPKITAKPASYKLKVKAKKYTVSLMNKNKIVKNKKVTIKINGKTYTTKTNSKGQATFTMRNLKKTGTYNAVITATGNYYYNKVTKKVKITVKP